MRQNANYSARSQETWRIPHTWLKQDSNKETASSNVWETESSQIMVDDKMEQLSNSLNSTCKINVAENHKCRKSNIYMMPANNNWETIVT